MATRSPKPGYGSAFIGKIHPNASIDLDEKHLAAIGRVAASWSLLEYAIDRAICHLSAMGNEEGYCVTSQIISSTYKMKVFMSLAEFRGLLDKDKLRQANKLQNEMYRLVDERNRAVHDVWFKDSITGQHFRHQMVSKSGSLMLDNIPVDLAKIEELIALITKLRKDFVNFWMWLPNKPSSPSMFPSTSILLQ
jgi:hypothetical protein